MVGNDNINPIKSIIIYIRSPLVVALEHITPKVSKKQHKTLHLNQLFIIRRNQSNTATLTWFLLIALHSVSQVITRANTDKIALYNRTEEACCVNYGASEDRFLDYSTFRTYHLLQNRYATLGYTKRLPIEGIGTDVCTLSGKNILTRNAFHIP